WSHSQMIFACDVRRSAADAGGANHRGDADPAAIIGRHNCMRSRSVSQVIFAAAHQMGPLTVRQPLPSEQLPYLDPFVLLHHAPPRDFGGDTGVSWHPHRGFAPVTFIFKGDRKSVV